MSQSLLTITPTVARRLAVTRQRLAGPRLAADASGLMEVMRDLGCLQLDPTNAVARSHLLALWSRAGNYDPAQLDRLLWEERRLFEYWAHAASIVLTEDYPIHNLLMRNYPPRRRAWGLRTRQWIKQNQKLRNYILRALREDGPLPSRALEEDGLDPQTWVSSGWTSGRNVSRMLDLLLLQGKIMVAGRSGGQKLWDLAERCLPDWTPRERLSEREGVRRAAQRSLRALGVARPRHIEQHFIRGRYPGLAPALDDLEAEGRVVRVQIAHSDGGAWPGPWYVHADDLPTLERLQAGGEWQPRTTLLSPFDNLICDRARTELMFNFRFRAEIYVPQDRRQYGFFVLPILRGDQLIGRLDPLMDRPRRRLTINAVYAEPGAPPEAGSEIAAAIQNLAAFLGADEIVYSRRAPKMWKSALTG